MVHDSSSQIFIVADSVQPTIGFTEHDYQVSEGSSGVMVAIESSTVLGRSVQVRVFTSDITALGKCKNTSLYR